MDVEKKLCSYYMRENTLKEVDQERFSGYY